MAHYFITGASAGIGAALVTQLLQAGHSVSAVARRAERLHERGADFANQYCALPADVSDTDALHSAVKSACAAAHALFTALCSASVSLTSAGRAQYWLAKSAPRSCKRSARRATALTLCPA